MEWLDGIIKIAAVLGALGIIVGALIKLNALIKKTEKMFEHSEENYMNILRLIIMSSEMPIGERISAGVKYLDKGGNGDIKKFLDKEFNITDTVDKASHYKK